MKICRISRRGAAQYAWMRGEMIVPLQFEGSALDLLTGQEPSAEEEIPVAFVSLLNPLPKIRNIYCCAGNYYRHVQESGAPRPEKSTHSPRFFLKPSGTLIGPDEQLRIPPNSPDFIDWECEVAILIGKEGRRLSPEEATSHIAGYTIFNDFSNRRFRLNPSRTEASWDMFFDWLHGKWHDSFGALGPVVVSKDELPSDLNQTRLTLDVNGQRMQDSTLADMIYSPAEIVSFLSQIVTVCPGDLIATGTPAGVAEGGAGPFLKAGDVVEAAISGIGVLKTFVTSEQ